MAPIRERRPNGPFSIAIGQMVSAMFQMKIRSLYGGSEEHVYECGEFLYLHLYCRIAISKGNN